MYAGVKCLSIQSVDKYLPPQFGLLAFVI